MKIWKQYQSWLISQIKNRSVFQSNQESIGFDYKMQVEVSRMSESAFIETSIDLLVLAELPLCFTESAV